jgi:hypothetical protein
MRWWRHRRCNSYDIVPDPEMGLVVTWPCGMTLWLYTGGRLYVDQARAIHNYQLTRPT